MSRVNCRVVPLKQLQDQAESVPIRMPLVYHWGVMKTRASEVWLLVMYRLICRFGRYQVPHMVGIYICKMSLRSYHNKG